MSRAWEATRALSSSSRSAIPLCCLVISPCLTFINTRLVCPVPCQSRLSQPPGPAQDARQARVRRLPRLPTVLQRPKVHQIPTSPWPHAACTGTAAARAFSPGHSCPRPHGPTRHRGPAQRSAPGEERLSQAKTSSILQVRRSRHPQSDMGQLKTTKQIWFNRPELIPAPALVQIVHATRRMRLPAPRHWQLFSPRRYRELDRSLICR